MYAFLCASVNDVCISSGLLLHFFLSYRIRSCSNSVRKSAGASKPNSSNSLVLILQINCWRNSNNLFHRLPLFIFSFTFQSFVNALQYLTNPHREHYLTPSSNIDANACLHLMYTDPPVHLCYRARLHLLHLQWRNLPFLHNPHINRKPCHS